PETGMIQMMTITLLQAKSKNNIMRGSTRSVSYYMPLISYIDPESLQIIKKVVLPAEGLDNYAKSKGINKDGFRGLPVNMILNSDNTTTLLLEEKSEYTNSRSC